LVAAKDVEATAIYLKEEATERREGNTMTAGAKIVAALGLIIVLGAGGVAATQGPRLAHLRTEATAVVWLGPDEMARISEAYLRPHLLTHIDHIPAVRWVGWNDRRRTLTEPPRRRARMRVAAWLF